MSFPTLQRRQVYPSAYRNFSYDPVKDFIPIVDAARFELALVVNKEVPVNTLAEFIAWCAQSSRARSTRGSASSVSVLRADPALFP